MSSRFNNSLYRLLTLLLILNTQPLFADSIPENLRQWEAGASTNNQPTAASFAGGVSADDGKHLAKTFDASQKIDVLTYIRPAPEHVGKTGSLYIVARYNNVWFMKASDDQWQVWNLQLAGLVANTGSRTLQALESLVVAPQLSNLVGKFDVFVGYKVDGDIYYNAQSFGFKVNPTTLPQQDAIFNDANAWKLPIPSDATMIPPEEFKT